MSEMFTALTTENFSEAVQDKSGLIIFHKKLCPHCKIMMKVLEKVLIQLPELHIYTVDSEDYPELMELNSVSRVPTICSLRGGKIVGMQIGIRNAKETIEFYNNN